MNPNARNQQESYAEFQKRRSDANLYRKLLSKGRIIWPHRNGTYIRAKHGHIGSK